MLGDRRSRREFKGPLTLQQLGDVLWHSYRVRRTARMDGGFLWESRPSPSGGGCYPIQVLVLRAAFLPRSLLLYDPNYHAFSGPYSGSLPTLGVLAGGIATLKALRGVTAARC